MLGSLVYVGGMALEAALEITDRDGVSVGDELDRIGYRGTAPIPGRVPHAFVELHIEQGPVLEDEDITIGVVEGVQGISWTELTLTGQSCHAGTTPMRLRHDPSFVAADITTFVRHLASEFGGSQVATVGSVTLTPNLVNVVPSEAVMTVDLRNTDDEVLQRAETRFRGHVAQVAETEGVGVETRTLARFEPVTFDSRVIDIIEQVHGRPRPVVEADAVRRRPRRPDVRSDLPDRDDLHQERQRHQPQRHRVHRARRPRSGRQRPARRVVAPDRGGVLVTRSVNVGAAQLGPIARNEGRDEVVERLLALLRRGAEYGCELVVFPELALTTFFPRWYLDEGDESGIAGDTTELDSYYETEMPNPATQPLFDEAKRLAVGFCLGYAELTPDGHRYNTYILVDRAGEIVGKYRKVHIPGHEAHEPWRQFQHLERRYFEESPDGFGVHEAFGGTVGMAICNDRRWPETYRVLGLQGAEMILIGYNTPLSYAPDPSRTRSSRSTTSS